MYNLHLIIMSDYWALKVWMWVNENCAVILQWGVVFPTHQWVEKHSLNGRCLRSDGTTVNCVRAKPAAHFMKTEGDGDICFVLIISSVYPLTYIYCNSSLFNLGCKWQTLVLQPSVGFQGFLQWMNEWTGLRCVSELTPEPCWHMKTTDYSEQWEVSGLRVSRECAVFIFIPLLSGSSLLLTFYWVSTRLRI